MCFPPGETGNITQFHYHFLLTALPHVHTLARSLGWCSSPLVSFLFLYDADIFLNRVFQFCFCLCEGSTLQNHSSGKKNLPWNTKTAHICLAGNIPYPDVWNKGRRQHRGKQTSNTTGKKSQTHLWAQWGLWSIVRHSRTEPLCSAV